MGGCEANALLGGQQRHCLIFRILLLLLLAAAPAAVASAPVALRVALVIDTASLTAASLLNDTIAAAWYCTGTCPPHHSLKSSVSCQSPMFDAGDLNMVCFIVLNFEHFVPILRWCPPSPRSANRLRHSGAGGLAPRPAVTTFTLSPSSPASSTACTLSSNDALALQLLVAGTDAVGAPAAAAIVFASACALSAALPTAVIASGAPVLHVPPVAPSVASLPSLLSAPVVDTAATAPTRHFVRSDAVFCAHESSLVALAAAAQSLAAAQQWQRVALLTTADAAGHSAQSVLSATLAQTSTMAPALGLATQMIDVSLASLTAAAAASSLSSSLSSANAAPASNLTAAVAALFGAAAAPAPHRVLFVYVPRALLPGVVQALAAAGAYGRGFALTIVTQDGAFDPVWTNASLVEAAAAGAAASPSSSPSSAQQIAAAVLSGALVAQSTAARASSTTALVAYATAAAARLGAAAPPSLAAALSATVATVESATTRAQWTQLAGVDDLVSLALQAAAALVAGVVPPAAAAPTASAGASSWASSALSRQMRSPASNAPPSPLSSVYGAGAMGGATVAFSIAPSAWLAGWNQSAASAASASASSSSSSSSSPPATAELEAVAFAWAAARAGVPTTVLNFVALAAASSTSTLTTSLDAIGTVAVPTAAAVSTSVSWPTSSLLASSIVRFGRDGAPVNATMSWAPTSWPNSMVAAANAPSIGASLVAAPPSARRFFFGLHVLQPDTALVGVRMALAEGAGLLSPLTGDSLELDPQLVLTDPCDGSALGNESAVARMSRAVASGQSSGNRVRPTAVIGLSCSSSSAAAADVYGAAVPPVPLISLSSTSPLLANATRYPYFLRLVRGDTAQAAAMVAFVNAFGAV
jgi:hypothetical protein